LAAAVNLDVFNELSPAHQKIIEYAAMATTHTQLAETLANNGAALARLQQQGVKTMQFSDDVWDAFGAASAKVMDENMGDELFAKTRASFEASLTASAEWLSKSDAFYVAQRERVRAAM
jgi:TRAP-type mannitol/chloroaromatic compound transport system substrate-binding protein